MRTRWLLSCGVVAGPLFTLVYLLEGATRDDGYSAFRHPVSSLALGRQGWMQVANFLTTGALLIAFGLGAGRHSKWLARILAGVGVGLIGAGVFITDPIGGYPPGTHNPFDEPVDQVPPVPSPRSKSSALHQFFSTFVFLGLPAAFVVEARRGPRLWTAYSIATCAAFLGTFAASSAGFAQSPRFVGVGGLFQRLALVTGFTWVTVCAARLLRGIS